MTNKELTPEEFLNEKGWLNAKKTDLHDAITANIYLPTLSSLLKEYAAKAVEDSKNEITGAQKVLKWINKYCSVNGNPNHEEIIAQLEMAIEEESLNQNPDK